MKIHTGYVIDFFFWGLTDLLKWYVYHCFSQQFH